MATVDPPLRTPFNVSPFIRFSRWALLIGGVAWGIHRQKVNSKTEQDYQEFIAKMKPIWMENKARILAERQRGELKQIAGIINIPVPADFDKQYPSYSHKAPIDPELLPEHALTAYKKGKGKEVMAKADSVKF